MVTWIFSLPTPFHWSGSLLKSYSLGYTLVFSQLDSCFFENVGNTSFLKHTFVLIYLKPLLGHLLNFCFFSVSTMHFSPLSTVSISFAGFHLWSYSLLTLWFSWQFHHAPFLNYHHMEMTKSVFCRGTSFLLCPKLKSSQTTSFCSYLTEWHNALFKKNWNLLGWQ